ncbi:hypothetical protein MKK67_25715 [Methylobacterium sp. J-072]|uniref:hypothetical protein n=1 Tax=Methylobacterium sp. J-072 TaxID=2836651 RepID=UPI001FBA8C95|nr:hypothetical protein [Methylobacterium sp. J-072]MCJ2095870.1 hypothetical protein [Methylobacterium sp. J-072]
MTSEPAIRANRRNAQASTGPRTRAGKARAGQNARKHGLSATDPNPAASADIERLARLIADEHHAGAAALGIARDVAEAQFQLQQVRAFKTALLRNTPLAPDDRTKNEDRLAAELLLELFRQLESLD